MRRSDEEAVLHLTFVVMQDLRPPGVGMILIR
jgi:hypothetical protein